MDSITSLLTVFKTEAKAKSKLFCFWDEYISMVLVLLQFIKAERTGKWSLHLSSTAGMIPHFFAMDRSNYARWLPIYLADMYMLEETHSEVFKEFSTNRAAGRGRFIPKYIRCAAFSAQCTVSLVFMLLTISLLGPCLSHFFLDYFNEISFN